MSNDGLKFGPLRRCAHLCVDMQLMFDEATPWHTPWLGRILPQVVALAEHAPEATFFSRFIPLQDASEGVGTWRRFYERWDGMTLAALDPALLDLVVPLAQFVPPARLIDKRAYSPWLGTSLHYDLQATGINTLIISGAETDVCVAAAVSGAIDLGYRVVLPDDAICGSADPTHDAMMRVFGNRFSLQIELASTVEVIDAWVSDK